MRNKKWRIKKKKKEEAKNTKPKQEMKENRWTGRRKDKTHEESSDLSKLVSSVSTQNMQLLVITNHMNCPVKYDSK